MIGPTLARMIVREHLYMPIQGKVLTLGRQTIAMTYEQFIELLQQEQFPLDQDKLNQITITKDQKTRSGKETSYISDDVFFNLLGIKDFHAMDVSSYEGADIIHDLNERIPESLRDQFDFIIDGGTFDHLVDVRTAFENVVQMLKVGGRVFQWNAASNFTGQAYISFGPDLFYDYYVLNQFADCKVYIAEVDGCTQPESWDLYEFEGSAQFKHFQSKRVLITVVLAEKGLSSTYDRIPIQARYRDTHFWEDYRNSQKKIHLSKRRSFVGTRVPRRVKGGSVEWTIPKLLSVNFKEKGFVWVCKKSISRFFLFLSQSFNKENENKEIKGFKYIGKI